MEYASILDTVKEGNDIEVEDHSFDNEILMHINSSIAILNQLKVGKDNFRVTGETETWDDYITDIVQLEMAKEYLTKRTGLYFNPPRSQFLLTNMKNQVEELEYRLNLQVDP